MKATFTRLAAAAMRKLEQSIYAITFLSLLFWVHPALVNASSSQVQEDNPALIFNIEPKSNSAGEVKVFQPSLTLEEIINNDPLTKKVEDYLTAQGSPLASCTTILLKQASWKKILSLSNAESAFGKRTIAGTFNYWGVMAGRTLKKMGNDPCDAVVNMQHFLEEYPRNSAVKYKDMQLDCGRTKKQRCMNGFYKQPYKVHWTTNNVAILNVLDRLESEAAQERIALASRAPVIAAANEIILAQKK